MTKLLVVFLGMLAAANAISFFDLVKEEWHAFKVSAIIIEQIRANR